MTGNDTYTGLTTISAGTLALAGTGAIPNTSGIKIASGATFDVTAVGGFTVGSGKSMIDNGLVKGPLTVNGKLSGAGVVSGPVTAGTGIIDPGTDSTIGTLSFQSGLILGGGTYAAKLDAASSESDLIAVIGLLDLSGVDALSLGLLDGLVLDGVTSYTIATFDLLAGTFDSVQNLPGDYKVEYQ